MKSKGYTEEQIIRILQEVESGSPVASVCRQYGVSEATVHAGAASTRAWTRRP
jgi:putative transposase